MAHPETTSSGLSSSNTIKRKRDEAPAYRDIKTSARPHTNGDATPSVALVAASQAVDYLRSKGSTEKSFQDIIGFLSIQHNDPTELRRLELLLKNNASVTYNPKGLGGKGSMKFKPKIPVTNAEELKAFLQKKTESTGVHWDEIKDGWPEGTAQITAMGEQGELLVIKDKKGSVKRVWQDDPTIHNKIAPDLQIAWNAIPLPANADDVRDKLKAATHKCTKSGH